MATKRVKTQENEVTATTAADEKKKKNGTKRGKRTAGTAEDPRSLDRDARHSLVAAEAYYRAERRGFTAGHELEDWVAAERVIDSALTGPPAS
jgi:hypothetical protein